MALPFFRALNPTSVNSGINYSRAYGLPCNNLEMIDKSVIDTMYQAIYLDEDLISALYSSYTMTIGCHYDLNMHGANDARGGAKGILDYLIFPLIARKLIADESLPENVNNSFSILLVLFVGIPLEITRLLIGTILTIVLFPFILFMRGIKACVDSNNDNDNDNDNDVESQTNAEKIMHLNKNDIPNDYKCPISMEIMTDPVQILDSTSPARFERSSIDDLIKANGNMYCVHPLTRERINFKLIKGDVDLKKKIREYVNQLLKAEQEQEQEQEQHQTQMH